MTIPELQKLWKSLKRDKECLRERIRSKATGWVNKSAMSGFAFEFDKARKERLAAITNSERLLSWMPRSKRFSDDDRWKRRATAQPKWASHEIKLLRDSANRYLKSTNTVGKVPIALQACDELRRFVNLLPGNIQKRFKTSKNFKNFKNVRLMIGPFYDGLDVLVPNFNRRRRKWSLTHGLTSRVIEDVDHESTYKNGSWRTVSNASHLYQVRCFVVLKDSHHAEACMGEHFKQWTAPEGYSFGIDEHGVKLFRNDSPKDDYHIGTSDVCGREKRSLVEQLEANRQRRLQVEAEKRAVEAEAEGVWVCVRDSLRAGNCRAGTESFAVKHGFDVRKHYPAKEVLNRANGDYGRARLAISAAISRHRKEMEVGYAELESHST